MRGTGTIGYLELEPPGEALCYAILDATAEPADHGYPTAREISREDGYVLYQRPECG